MNDHRAHLKQTVIMLVIYAMIVYVAYAIFDAVRQAKTRQVLWSVMFALLGFGIGAFWMFKHMTCETCQQRWKGLVRRTALRFVE